MAFSFYLFSSIFAHFSFSKFAKFIFYLKSTKHCLHECYISRLLTRPSTVFTYEIFFNVTHTHLGLFSLLAIIIEISDFSESIKKDFLVLNFKQDFSMLKEIKTL